MEWEVREAVHVSRIFARMAGAMDVRPGTTQARHMSAARFHDCVLGSVQQVVWKTSRARFSHLFRVEGEHNTEIYVPSQRNGESLQSVVGFESSGAAMRNEHGHGNARRPEGS